MLRRLQNTGMVSDHRSTQETGTSSSNDVSNKRAKQALEDAHMVSWLNTPQAYEHGESEKHRQARLMADFKHMNQVGLGRKGIAIDVREEDDKDETLSGAQGAPAGLEGVGAWAGHVKK